MNRRFIWFLRLTSRIHFNGGRQLQWVVYLLNSCHNLQLILELRNSWSGYNTERGFTFYVKRRVTINIICLSRFMLVLGVRYIAWCLWSWWRNIRNKFVNLLFISRNLKMIIRLKIFLFKDNRSHFPWFSFILFNLSFHLF